MTAALPRLRPHTVWVADRFVVIATKTRSAKQGERISYGGGVAEEVEGDEQDERGQYIAARPARVLLCNMTSAFPWNLPVPHSRIQLVLYDD